MYSRTVIAVIAGGRTENFAPAEDARRISASVEDVMRSLGLWIVAAELARCGGRSIAGA